MSGVKGPLKGFRFIEIAGIGPTQLTGMLLADMGADIVRIERLEAIDIGVSLPRQYDIMNRSRRSLALDLKHDEGKEVVLRMCEEADVLFEGFRPGVMEKLGLGPTECMARNPSLVYGRMTGWGQSGPLAQTAGHDPNYIAISGALSQIGEADQAPVYPLNVIGDFGGGSLYLALGIVSALLERSKSGSGQVVDAAMVDGVASMLTFFYGLQAAGLWSDKRGSNILDGGAPFIRPYRTRDDRFIVIAALEERFYEILLEKLDINKGDLPAERMNPKTWPALQHQFEEIFAGKTRDEWIELFAGSDACFSPILSLQEAVDHPHARDRGTYVEVDGITQPAPAPRFSRSGSAVQSGPAQPGQHSLSILGDWGFNENEIERLQSGKIIYDSNGDK